MTDIVQGWNSTPTAVPEAATVSYVVDASNVKNTNGPVVWRRETAGQSVRWWIWFRNGRKWVRRGTGPDARCFPASAAEVAWINACRGEHVETSWEREAKETEA